MDAYLVTCWGCECGIYSTLRKARAAGRRIAKAEASDPADCVAILQFIMDQENPKYVRVG